MTARATGDVPSFPQAKEPERPYDAKPWPCEDHWPMGLGSCRSYACVLAWYEHCKAVAKRDLALIDRSTLRVLKCLECFRQLGMDLGDVDEWVSAEHDGYVHLVHRDSKPRTAACGKPIP